MGFARGDREHLYPAESVNGPEDSEQRRDWTFGKESALRRELRSYTAAEEQGCSGHDEDHDGGELDHGEPEFEASVGTYAAEVDEKKQGRKYEDPKLAGHGGEPVGHVSGGSREFGSDGESYGGPVCGAAEKSQILVEVEFAVEAERSGGGVHAGQFAQSHGDGVGDEGGDDVADDDAGSGDFESCGG